MISLRLYAPGICCEVVPVLVLVSDQSIERVVSFSHDSWADALESSVRDVLVYSGWIVAGIGAVLLGADLKGGLSLFLRVFGVKGSWLNHWFPEHRMFPSRPLVKLCLPLILLGSAMVVIGEKAMQ